MEKFIDKINKEHLREYLQKCSNVVNIDKDLAFDTTLNYIKKHNGLNISENDMIKIINLENKWYKSIKENNPDYSVYSDPYYFCETWLCWIKYSRRYLKEIQSKKSLFNKSICDDMSNVNVILDLGCGSGYTTGALKEIFVDSKVYGTNIENTNQYNFAKELGKNNNFNIIGSHNNIKCDLIFASEYFEHFKNPIEHLIDILMNCNPEYMIIANTFTQKAIGHFDNYVHNNKNYNGKQISKLFNSTLIKEGYEKVKTKCWNNRPMYWKKIKYNQLPI